MAQGSKSRIIIWTIVAILVVVAVVMLVTKPKTSSRPPVNPERFSRNYERLFARLEGKAADARVENPGAPAEQWQKIDEEITSGRRIMAGMLELTEQEDLGPRRDSVQKAFLAAKKVLKAVTGEEYTEEPAGGE